MTAMTGEEISNLKRSRSEKAAATVERLAKGARPNKKAEPEAAAQRLQAGRRGLAPVRRRRSRRPMGVGNRSEQH